MRMRNPVFFVRPLTLCAKNAPFYQDRLGTNIGKALTTSDCFLRSSQRGGLLRRVERAPRSRRQPARADAGAAAPKQASSPPPPPQAAAAVAAAAAAASGEEPDKTIN
jgi:hypothetical protein